MYVFSGQPVRAYYDVYAAIGYAVEYLFRFFAFSCPAEIFHCAWEIFQSAFECLVVLVGQDCGRYEHCHLFVVGNSLECGPYRHFRFSETDVAADEPVHRRVAFHVVLHVLCGFQLVGGIFVDERGFQLMLHETVGTEAETFLFFPFGVEFYQVSGYVFYFCLGSFFQFLPCSGAEFVQAGLFSVLAFVFGYLVQRMYGNEHHVIVLVYEFDDLLCGIAAGYPDQSGKFTYAVIGVHHIVAGMKHVEVFQCQSHFSGSGLVAFQIVFVEAVEYLMVGEAAYLRIVVDEAFMQGLVDGREGYVFVSVFKYRLDSFYLFVAVATDVYVISFFRVCRDGCRCQVEVLMKQRLFRHAEPYGGIGRAGRSVAEFYPPVA